MVGPDCQIGTKTQSVNPVNFGISHIDRAKINDLREKPHQIGTKFLKFLSNFFCEFPKKDRGG